MVPEYTAEDLFLQLRYLKSLFDVEGKIEELRKSGAENMPHLVSLAKKHEKFMESAMGTVEQFIDVNARNYVDLSELFSFLSVQEVKKEEVM